MSGGEFTADDCRRLAAAVAHWLTTVPDGVVSSIERRHYRELRDRLQDLSAASGTNSGEEPDGSATMDNMISVADFAALRGCRAEYVRRLCRQDRLPAVKVGRDWLIDRQAVA